MKTDITNKNDIIRLVNAFYEKIKLNPILSHYFTEVVRVNWERHLPIMYDFWENTIFYTGNYNGNPMRMHQGINRRHQFATTDFKEWLRLFTETVDEFFEGEKAELIKQRAHSIATIMQIKIIYPQTESKNNEN